MILASPCNIHIVGFNIIKTDQQGSLRVIYIYDLIRGLSALSITGISECAICDREEEGEW